MLLPFDTITRTGDFDDRTATMHLRPWQWRFLLAVDGRTRLDDLARGCGIEFETAADLVHETVGLGLLEIVTQTLEDYRAMQAPAAEPSAFASQVTPVAETVAAPMKKLSVSFDALNSIFADPAPVATVATAARYEDKPFAFETPDHMAPYIEHSSLGDAPVEVPHIVHETPMVKADPTIAAQAPSKSVSFSLFATNFGAPETPPAYESASVHATHLEIASNGHAVMPEITHEPIAEHEIEHELVDARADSHVTFETAQDVNEHSAIDTRAEAPTHEVVAEHAPVTADVAAPASPKDDVLLQHYYVGANGASSGPAQDGDSTKANGDLTGNLLRALGLKK